MLVCSLQKQQLKHVYEIKYTTNVCTNGLYLQRYWVARCPRLHLNVSLNWPGLEIFFSKMKFASTEVQGSTVPHKLW